MTESNADTKAPLTDSPERAALRDRLRTGLREPARLLDASYLPSPTKALKDVSPLEAASDKLERLVDKSLDRLDDVLEMDPFMYGDAEGQMSVVRAHLSAAEKILNTQVRVDQNRLRKRQGDTLTDLLDELKQREKNMPAVLTLEAEAI